MAKKKDELAKQQRAAELDEAIARHMENAEAFRQQADQGEELSDNDLMDVLEAILD